ncbi:serine/threonine-protein kinase [Streptomyces sp. NPDC000410]|uniref:serine/threonine-protein kinase n=1 Tax=Streptomyces sp. NPDC000410 TaxID=3154254 RepID=UPI0033301EBF
MSEVPGTADGGRGDDGLVAGRYRLLAHLGEGGMGVVWRARDELLGREVAVKEVRAPAELGTSDVRRLYARLEREGWAAARISHRNVVTVYDVAAQDGRPWIVMELIRGLSLSDALESEGPMAPRRAAHIGAEVLAALRAAHGAGVLHRDVKPGNVLLANDGRVVLTDFGIAMVEGTSNLTMTGELVGSPEFLAPERALGRTPGPESDLWSLGVLLYAAVEGISPFRQNTPLSTLRAVVDEELPPPRRAGALEPVIAGLLRKDPAERLSADEAERQLRIVGAGGTPRTASAPPPPTPSPSPSGAYEPPVPSPSVSGASGAYDPTVASAAPTTPVPQERPRRAAIALVAGSAALVLAIGGLTYALVNRNNADDAGGSGGGGKGSSAGAPADTPSASSPSSTPSTPDPTGTIGTTGTPSPEQSSTPTGGHTPAPPQSVQVYVKWVRDSYSGACPPPEAEAPAFTATVTVGRTPASVEYRWVTESGESSAPGWRTLGFPAAEAGKGTLQEVDHTELTYELNATRHDRIRLEVRSPVVARSNWVEFSVTCEEEPPTDGPSYPTDSLVPTPRP